MTLSQILTVMIALPCMIAFGSLGGGFQNTIAGVSGVDLGSTMAAAGNDLAIPDLGGQFGAGGDMFDGTVRAAAPTLGEGGPLGSSGQGAEGQAAGSNGESGLQPGQYAGPSRTDPATNDSGMKNLAEGMQGKFDNFFTLDNFGGPLLAAVGGVAATIAGGLLPATLGKGIAAAATAGFWAKAGAVALKALTVVGSGALLIPLKAVLIVGGAALAIGAVGWGIYKVVKHFWPDIQENMFPAPSVGPQVGSGQLGASEGQSDLPSEEELADMLDTDGDGVSLEDEIAAENESEQPGVTVPDLNGSSEETAKEPEAPAPKTAAEKLANSLINGNDSESRDKLQELLAAADSKSNAQIEKQASEILSFLSDHGYGGNAKVQQWTEEAILMGYDPRLLLALVQQSRSGDYSTAILNDFGGAWNAISDDAEVYEIIDQLGNCGGGASCASAMTQAAHGFVSGNGPRLSANPNASANEMAAELIEAIEMYLSGDAIALHTAESIRPLLDAYPR